jgi:flavin reductase (DIM6/NTAB) family NADH-FMN oxidoreductase RutF
MRIDPNTLTQPELHAYLLGLIAPRPIAWVSTIDQSGNVNLAPYSFFNVFSSNPPVIILSPAFPRSGEPKHTLTNVQETGELVINIVSFPVVEQMSLTSTAYPKGVNEFVKSGLSEMQSEVVKPPKVKESIASFECKMTEIIKLGDLPGAGNLILCEVLLGHVSDDILDENGKPDPLKADLVGRMGGDWYVRAQGEALFKLPKPNRNLGIGIDNLPDAIRNSSVLTGNNLGRLGNIEKLPDSSSVEVFGQTEEIKAIKERFINDQDSFDYHLHELAQDYLRKNELEKAWMTLLQTIKTQT